MQIKIQGKCLTDLFRRDFILRISYAYEHLWTTNTSRLGDIQTLYWLKGTSKFRSVVYNTKRHAWNLAWLSSERLYPAADWGWCRDSQTHIRWRLRTPKEELGEGLKALKEMATPQEDQQCQLSWTNRHSQTLSLQPETIHELVLDTPAHR